MSVDSYNYFGRGPSYLGEHLLPLVKHGGELLFAIPGMARDCHDGTREAWADWITCENEYTAGDR